MTAHAELLVLAFLVAMCLVAALLGGRAGSAADPS